MPKSEPRQRPRSATSLRVESPEAADLKVPERPTMEDITESRKQINAVLTELGSATFQIETLRQDHRSSAEDVAQAASHMRSCEAMLKTLLDRDVRMQCVLYALDRQRPGGGASPQSNL